MDPNPYLENLLDYAHAPIVIWDHKCRILRFNHAFERLTGLTAQEVIGQTPEILIPEKYRSTAMDQIRSTTKGERWAGVEIPILRKNGDNRIILWNSAPICEEKCIAVVATIAQGLDITERVNAEELLVQAHDELETRVRKRTLELKAAVESLGIERHRLYDVLETLPVYVCLLDKDYRMPFVNRYFREAFGDPKRKRCYDSLFCRSEPCETCETYTVMKTGAPHHWFWTGPNGRDYDIFDYPFTDTDGSSMILEMGIDITERNKAEEERAALASIVEHSEDAIIGKSLDGVIRSWNAGAGKMYGYSASEAIGQHVSVLLPPGADDDPGYILDRIRNGEPVFQHDTVRMRKDGSLIQVSLTVSPIKDRNGVLIGASSIARDISERKMIADTIGKANVYNRSLIESSLDPLVTIAPDGTISDVNAATIRITGYSRGELIGTDFSNYFTEPAKAKAGYIHAFREGTITDYALEIRNRNGHVTPVLYNATVYRDTFGIVIGVFASARDITERKTAEIELRKAHDLLEKRVKERTLELVQSNTQLKEEISQRKVAESLVKKTLSELQAAIESTADGIYVVDRAGKIIRYNQNFASMWKIPDALLQSGNDRRMSAYLRTLVKNPDLFKDSDASFPPKDRETYDMLELKDGRIFERYSKPQKMDTAIIGRVLSYRDVTDRRCAEDKLRASLQEKEILIREIHHRVKNNLQIITGLLDMTRMRTKDNATTEILTDMMMKIKTMAQIHTRLYESKQVDKINMGGQIRDQVADLSNIYGRSGPEIICQVDAEELNLPVDQAIPCALVVNEALSNSFKHAFNGRRDGVLMVSAWLDGGMIHIRVHDDGIGIPTDVDIDRATSLGLKLIRNLVQQLRGTLKIESTEPGTAVNVAFPLSSE
ncbi:MAG: PAS domain S-box protein [Methanoregula sp.]|jgi:PAS domain S-box-containing protein|nr:PAS domain S-box protein [Methanoregula sp.]